MDTTDSVETNGDDLATQEPVASGEPSHCEANPRRPSPARTAFDRGDYADARQLLASSGSGTDEDSEFLEVALGWDRVLLTLPVVLLAIWLYIVLAV